MSYTEHEVPAVEPASQKEKEFTFRAVLVGLVVGNFLCFTNMYFGLQSGWVTMGTLQTCIMGAGIFRLLKFLPYFQGFTVKENVVLQTTAVATGTMPLAAGFVGILPAMKDLGTDLNTWQSLLWTLSIAYFGCFVAVPLRTQTILVEKLKFPSGTASAQLISVLHSNEEKTVRHKRWKALGISYIFSTLYSFLSFFVPVTKNMPVFTWLGLPQLTTWLWTFNPALAYVGQGMIMGFRATFSAFLGSLMGWAILGPMAKKLGWVEVVERQAGKRSADDWVLWIALAIMLAEATVALSITSFKVVRAQFNRKKKVLGADPAPKEEQIPTWWWTSGLVLSIAVCAAIDTPIFGMPFWQPLLGCFIGMIVSLVAVRALGETDLNPVSSIGKVSQVIFGFISPNNVIANLVGGAIAEAGAQQAGDLMSALKTGHLLRGSPKAQFKAQLVGTTASVFISVGAYQLYKSAYNIGSPELSAPAAKIWKDMAELMKEGMSGLPIHVSGFCIGGAIFGAIIPLIQLMFPKTTNFLPSGTAFAVGLYLQPYWVTPRLLGAIIASVVGFYDKRAKRRAVHNNNEEETVPLLFSPNRSNDSLSDLKKTVGNNNEEKNGYPQKNEEDIEFYSDTPRRLAKEGSVSDLATDSESDEEGDSDNDELEHMTDNSYGTLLIIIASGLVLGDGITSIVIAALSAGGVMPLTCAGCIGSLCGKGCS